MTAPSILNSRGLLGLFGVIIAAAAIFAILWALARAPDQSDRLAGIRRLTALASPPAARAGPPSPYLPGAVCGSGLAPAEALLKVRLTDAAKAAGVEFVQLDLTPIPGEPLSSVRLAGRIEGPYASGLNFMKIVADQSPTVFLDSLKVARGPNEQTAWDFSGRAYCAIRLSS